jgi:aminoglycoside phosphotransferase family enzyme/predicted kinase
MTDATPDHDVHTQARVFAFLTDPAAHPAVRRIDTHAASVFLEGARALKIKRAVRFPFLDYSTLQKRKAACDDEIRINRPFAPQIYHRVVPITQGDDGALHLDGPGTPIEYAIEMTRFDESQTLDHLAEAGPLDPALVAAMADAIAASHVAAPCKPAQAWIDGLPALIEGNATALRAAGCFAPDQIDDLTRRSLAAFARIRPLLELRGAEGFVRRCHGDLHLANLVMIEQKPVLFDAIEFSESIATIDVLYDLAFPLMDLLRYGQTAAANGLFNRYLAITQVENLAALASLPLFQSVRAAVRSHVLRARLERAGSGQAAIAAAAGRYFELARSLIDPPAPMLVAVGGLSGTGKSVQARLIAPLLAPLPGAVVLRSDVLRKQLFGVAETEKLPAAAYQPEISRKIYRMIEQRAGEILSQGHSVVVDAVFSREDERAATEAVARGLNVPFNGLFLTASLTIRQRRIGHRAADASDATAAVAESQESYDIGRLAWASVDASGTPKQTFEQCRQRISMSGQPKLPGPAW